MLLGLAPPPDTSQLGSEAPRTGWSEEASGVLGTEDTLLVLNKLDLVGRREEEEVGVEVLRSWCEGVELCSMSCKTGEGVEVFMSSLARMLEKMYVGTIELL